MDPRYRRQLTARALFGEVPSRLVLVLAMAWLVSGCPDDRWDLQPIEASKSAIRFEHADFDPELAEYAADRDPRTGGEVHLARFSGAGAFAVVLVLKAGASQVVEERAMERYLGRLMNGADVAWGESGRVPSRIGYVRYRMFRFADQPGSCVGFSQTVGETHDGRGRKRNLVIGYFCYDESRPLSAVAAADLIGKISFGR